MAGKAIKRTAAALCAAAELLTLAGCGASMPKGAARNDVLTLKPVDQNKMLITVRAEYNVAYDHMEEALEKRFPDVDFVFRLHCSRETQYELRQCVESGETEDIMLSPHFNTVSDAVPGKLLNLSGEDFISNYRGEALDSCAVNGEIYYLPGPSDMYGIVYDRTMFAEHGWKVPQSRTEFLRLCREIDGSGIRAIQPTCRYARQAQLFFTMFCYDGFFGGVGNFAWLKRYQEGSEKMAGHLDGAFGEYSALADAGVIRAEDFDVEPGNRSRMMYTDHSCAMIVENQLAETYAAQYKSDHEYGMMPFWCGDDPSSDHVLYLPNYYIAASASLNDRGNEKKRAKVLEALRYISSPEGQLAVAGGRMTMMPNVQGTEMEETDFNSGIRGTIRKGNAVAEPCLMASGNNNAAEKALQKGLKEYLEGGKQADGVMSACDSARDTALSRGLDRGAVVGSADRSFTRLETGLFIADALRQKGEADVGLCLVGKIICGMVGRIYKGDITEKDVGSLSLSLGATTGDKDDKKLWVVDMTGAQLVDFLKQAYLYEDAERDRSEPYFAASGLKIKFAPWADGESRLESAELSGGGKLDPEKTYTVALWAWPFGKECPYKVERVYDDSSEDIIAAAIRSSGRAVAPFDDGRFVLDWKKG